MHMNLAYRLQTLFKQVYQYVHHGVKVFTTMTRSFVPAEKEEENGGVVNFISI